VKSEVKKVLFVFFLCVFVSASSVFVYHRYFALKVYTVDLKELIDGKLEEYRNSGVSPGEAERDMEKYVKSLEGSIERLTNGRNVIVLIRQSVVAGGEDVTKEVGREAGKR